MPTKNTYHTANAGKVISIILAFVIFNASHSQTDTSNIDSLKTYASSNWQAQPEVCMDYAYKVAELSRQNNDTASYGWSLNFRGVLYGFTGNMDSSFYYYDSSVVYSKANGLQQNLLKSTMNLAINHQMLGNFQKSLDNFYAVLKLFEANGDSMGIAHSYGGMGNNYFNLGDYEQAEALYQKSIDIYENLGQSFFTATIYANLGVIYRDKNQPEKALAALQKAIPMLEATQQKIPLASAYINIATLYNKTDASQANEYYDKSIALNQEMGDNERLTTAYIGKGEVLLENGNPAESIPWLRKALPFSIENNSLNNEMLIYSRLSRAFEKLNQADSALFYYRKSAQISEKIAGQSVKEKVAELEVLYDTETKERQLAEQKAVIAQQEAREQKRNVQILVISLILAVIIFIGIFVFYSQRKKQERLQQQIALEKAEAELNLQEEKLRISRDLHDNVGSQLTFIISTLDNMNYIKAEQVRQEKLKTLHGFAQDTMAQLRETIWAIKSEEIGMDQLFSKVAEFVDKAKMACPDIEFTLTGKPGERILNSNEAIHVYRTIQEAINNAIKYANTPKITVHFDHSKITIVDDGVGFDLKTAVLGNGVNNMKARMKELGFHFNLHSDLEKGTTIELILN